MVALVASNDGLLDPAANRKADRPVLLVIGGIHAGEIDGKDAGLALLRDLAAGTARARPGRRDRGVRAGVQRRRARTLRAQPAPQPARPAPDRLPHHRPEPEPEPRLGEGRRARDGGDAGAVRRLGSGDAGRPARHRRREVRARRRGDRRPRALGVARAAAGGAGAERPADGRARPARSPAAAVLPALPQGRRSQQRRRRRLQRRHACPTATPAGATAWASWSRPTAGATTPTG